MNGNNFIRYEGRGRWMLSVDTIGHGGMRLALPIINI